jgi:hypothetical protein
VEPTEIDWPHRILIFDNQKHNELRNEYRLFITTSSG